MNLKSATDSSGNLINMSRNASLLLLDENKKERAKHRLPFGCKINLKDNSLNVDVSEDELASRKEQWRRPDPNYTTGALAKFASLVGSAANGAITKPAKY